MQQQAYVIYTADKKELISMLPIIRVLEDKHELLFVREGANKKVVEAMLVDEVRDIVYPPQTGRILMPYIMGLTSRSLIKELEKAEVKMIGFVGSDTSIINKRPNVEKADVLLRIARVCRKCEGVLKSEESFVTNSRAKEVRDQYRDEDDTDITSTPRYLNILVKDECDRGC